MDADLRDLLSAWLGGPEPDEARAAALLARLRADEPFRRSFVEEVHLLGLLEAVQSAEPRWLRLEDELGWGAAEAEEASFEDRVALRIHGLPPLPAAPRPQRGSWRWATAAAVLLVGSLAMWLVGGPRPAAAPTAAPPGHVAVVVKADDARWEPGEGLAPTEGSALPAGRLRLRGGRVTLTFFSGVMLSVAGPADVDLLSTERMFCRQGKLRARVPPGAEGFTVLAPGSAVVDLGTEFGLNVAEGKAEVMVFSGAAEVSILNDEGHTLRSALLGERRAVEVDPGAGSIRDTEAVPGRFVVAPELVAPALTLDPGYAAEVRRARPWGYWRFESLEGGLVPNEVPGGPPLRATGPVRLVGAPGANRSAAFGAGHPEQALELEGTWTPPREHGYAVELWALSEGFNVGAVASLVAHPPGRAERHAFLLELLARSRELLHDPCTVRFLDRHPPAAAGGVNVFSRGTYIPYRWHHVVAQKAGGHLELFIDGALAGTARADAREGTASCRLLLGRLKRGPQQRLIDVRPFVGRLDELAVYDRPLSPEQVRRHHALGAPAGTAPLNP